MTDTIPWIDSEAHQDGGEILDLMADMGYAFNSVQELQPDRKYMWHAVVRTQGDNDAFARQHVSLKKSGWPYTCLWTPWLGTFTPTEGGERLTHDLEQIARQYEDLNIVGLIIEPLGVFCRDVPSPHVNPPQPVAL
ncbi:hypothetical protein [Deinococcus marmoris]|uniref:hypothetical protein n=1 Tax=Deinococcus marmoris TaxID=249408 RepID=UPI00096AC440|nr:hypothetical protein [Deinococcus marmoris]